MLVEVPAEAIDLFPEGLDVIEKLPLGLKVHSKITYAK